MKRLGYGLAALFLSICMIGTASALTTGSTRIAVMDLQAVLGKSTEMAKLKNNLQKKFKPRRDALTKEEETLRDEVAKMEKNSSVMTKTQLTKTRAKLLSNRKALQDKQAAYQKELVSMQQKGMQKILASVRTQAKEIAQRQKYDLVVLKNNALYATDAIDITSQVSKALS